VDCFLGEITLKSREMTYPGPTKGFLWPSPYTAMLFLPFRCTHSSPLSTLLLTQNQSPNALLKVTSQIVWHIHAIAFQVLIPPLFFAN